MKLSSLVAAVLMVVIVAAAGACTPGTETRTNRQSGERSTTETPGSSSTPFGLDPTAAERTGEPARPPSALVLWSGRIAYPLITLTTWGECRFIIDRVERDRMGVLRVIGRESRIRCRRDACRHLATHRLSEDLRGGEEFEERVIVVSREPHYRVDARVSRVFA